MAGAHSRFVPSRTSRRVGSIVAGTAGGQALILLGMPVLTRLYSTADFGTLTVFTAIVVIVASMATLRLEMAIGLPKSASCATALGWSALASAFVVAALVAVACLLFGGPIANLLGVPDLAPMWWLIGMTASVLGAFHVMSAWMARAERYAAIGVRDFTAGLAQISTQIGLGLAGLKPVGLLLGLGMAGLAGVGALTSAGGMFRQPRPTLGQMRDAVVRYRRFPLIASWSAALNSAGTFGPVLVFAAFCGQAEVGLVGLAVRVLGAPSTLIAAAAARVFYGEATAAIREHHPVLRKTVWLTVRRLLLLGLFPSIIAVAFGPEIFGLVFGPAWEQAGTYASILSIGYLARFAVGGVTQTLLALERQAQQFRWDAGRLLMTVGLPMACLAAGATIHVAIAALAVAYVMSYSFLFADCLRAASHFDSTVSSTGTSVGVLQADHTDDAKGEASEVPQQ